MAYLLVKVSIDGKEITAFSFSYGVTPWTVVVFEIVMTFGLVYTVYVTAVDPKKGDIGITSPLAIGQIARANVLVWSTVVHFVSAR